MIRVAAALTCILLLTSPPAVAMVGGAQPTSEGAGRAVVMLTGSHGTFCSGVALTPDLVLTAAHCVLPGADYKLIDFDAGRQPVLKDIANIARHPEFDVNAVTRWRSTAFTSNSGWRVMFAISLSTGCRPASKSISL